MNFHNSGLLISQDFDDISLSFYGYDNGYSQYLENGTQTPRSFLKVQTFGPYNVNDGLVMKRFAICFVAITLLALKST
jgi:hypothetical protein